MKTILNSISSLILIIIVGGIALFFLNKPLFDQITTPFDISPCNFPIHYHLGSLDSRFGLSQTDADNDISQATHIWDSTYGKQLFAEDPKGNLTINFVYDARQALNTQINNLQGQISTEKSNLNPQIQEYNQKASDFQQKMSALNSEISYWNSKGGAPPDEYQKLIAEQQSLQQEANQLNMMAKNLNQSTDAFNVQVGELNQTVNTFNARLKVKPEEGLYVPTNNEIDIYFDITKTELIHTLSHELGHSLGMGHNSDSNSIMYPYTNNSITPSSEDMSSLQSVCKPEFILNFAAQKLANYIQTIENKNTQ